MLFALGAASTALNALQSLSTSSSTGLDQGSDNPFEVASTAPASPNPIPATGFSAASQISPATMSELLAAQSQSSTSTPASTSASSALQDLFSQIDGNGDGEITKSEFESALGAGGTNLAQADDVFDKLDSNGDGSVSPSELSSALKGAGGHHGHHHAASSAGTTSATSSYQSLGQLFQREAQAISFSVAPLSFNA